MKFIRSLLYLATFVVVLPLTAVGASLDPLASRAAIDAEIVRVWPKLDALYKDIHEHPELSLHETRTAALLGATMRQLGFEVTENVGGTGVVAIYKNGPGPVIMVRTELDALPMEEKTDLPYASRVQTSYAGGSTFVAHSCGHDNHMAWWVGTAEALLATRSQWSGTLMFVGQEGEEAGDGAHKMLKDGLFTRFPKPDFAIAAHVGNSPAGDVTVKDGVVSSNADGVQIVFHGVGAHGSNPSASIDPIVMGARFVESVQTVVSREKNADAFGVVTVGAFHAGTVGNIIPDQATLQLTLRSFTPEVRKLLLDGVDRTANAVAAMSRAPAPDIVRRGGAASVVNDQALADRAFTVLRPSFGDSVKRVPSSVPGNAASEDFSAYAEAGVPTLFLRIGGYDREVIAKYRKEGRPVPTNHSPFFAPDHEIAIKTGIRALTLTALGLLQPPK
jgi:hippurate hydrolase